MEHVPVLLSESIQYLKIKDDGIYLDGTFGRGGHTKEILKNLSVNGRVVAFDKDISAINYGLSEFTDRRILLVHDSFANINKYSNEKFDGILLDLGVSTPQLDTAERGFSFNKDSVLDMRMNNTCGMSARQWINKATEDEISDVLWKYAEERFAKSVAKGIVKYRLTKEIVTTIELADIVKNNMPYKYDKKHPATRTFQAIRIYINNELSDLECFLNNIHNNLTIGGRLVVISFHSLEDRIVKLKFNELSKEEFIPKWINKKPQGAKYKVIAKKIKPGLVELDGNVRSRSAILRCIEKVED